MISTPLKQAVVAGLFLLACVTEGLAQNAPAAEPIIISMGKSKLVELPVNYSDVMVGDPKIADILPLNQHSVYVVGKGMGSTSLVGSG